MSISNTKNTKYENKKKTKTAYIDWIPVEVSYSEPTTEKYQLFSDGLTSIVIKNAN